MATALFNVMVKKINAGPLRLNYFLALFFGLIHGMGFANAICFMLAKNQRIAIPLISFNIGLEAGQLVVVTAILLISYLLVDKPGIKRNGWIWTLSGTAFFIASKMAIERWPL